MGPRKNIRTALGDRGEQLAAEHLERSGLPIISRQHRTRYGEIDLIACDGSTLVFCEVKTRRAPGRPWDALGTAKRARVRRMAAAYLAEVDDRPRADELRFDAIGIVVDAHDRLLSLDHLEGAF